MTTVLQERMLAFLEADKAALELTRKIQAAPECEEYSRPGPDGSGGCERCVWVHQAVLCDACLHKRELYKQRSAAREERKNALRQLRRAYGSST